MDEQSIIGTREQLDARSGEDRRMATDRRRGNHRLQELNARRDGEETDRRRRDRREGGMSRLNFLWRWTKN
jgi:hypothetical protein